MISSGNWNRVWQNKNMTYLKKLEEKNYTNYRSNIGLMFKNILIATNGFRNVLNSRIAKEKLVNKNFRYLLKE